jgi:CDGSH iron-sulfur domain-containing protein 3
MKVNDNKNSTAIVEVIDNGPVKITGQIVLRDLKKDFTGTLTEVSLCRCGRSCNKPYCDDSHMN